MARGNPHSCAGSSENGLPRLLAKPRKDALGYTLCNKRGVMLQLYYKGPGPLEKFFAVMYDKRTMIPEGLCPMDQNLKGGNNP